MIGFVSTLVTHFLLITIKYSAIADLLTHWPSPGSTIKKQEITETHTPSIAHGWSLLITLWSLTGRRTFRGYLLPRTQNSELNCNPLSLMLRPTVSRPVCLGIKYASEAYDQIFITGVCWCVLFTISAGPHQRSYYRVRVPWDWRPHFTVSDSRLSFRRLLRLEGLRWRYSTPTSRKRPSPIDVDACLPLHCLATDFLYLCALARLGPHRKQFSFHFWGLFFLHSSSLTTSYDVHPIVTYSVAGCLSSRFLAILWKYPLQYYPPTCVVVFLVVSFIQVLPSKSYIHTSSIPCVLYSSLISSSLTLLFWLYLEKGTSYEAPHYTVSYETW
jgi:hypothetical protein